MKVHPPCFIPGPVLCDKSTPAEDKVVFGTVFALGGIENDPVKVSEASGTRLDVTRRSLERLMARGLLFDSEDRFTIYPPHQGLPAGGFTPRTEPTKIKAAVFESDPERNKEVAAILDFYVKSGLCASSESTGIFGNPFARRSASRILDVTKGVDHACEIIARLAASTSKYRPVIDTIVKLENKWDACLNHLQRLDEQAVAKVH